MLTEEEIKSNIKYFDYYDDFLMFLKKNPQSKINGTNRKHLLVDDLAYHSNINCWNCESCSNCKKCTDCKFCVACVNCYACNCCIWCTKLNFSRGSYKNREAKRRR